MQDYGPYVRIVLRYIVGAGLMGSAAIGEQMAQDPDLIFVICAAVGGLVEIYYMHVRKKGGAT